MTCKRCSYILYGSENYCPHCGEKNLQNNEQPTPNETAEPKPIFTTQDTWQEDMSTKSRIFQPEPSAFETNEPENKKQKAKSNGKGAVVFLSVLCALLVCLAAFTAMDYFDITPAISDFLSPREEATTAENLVSEKEFEAVFGTIEPQVSYAPTECIISSAKSISLRKGPADSYAQIDVLASGCEVQVIGGSAHTEDWAYVYVPEVDLYGWLCTSFMSGDIPTEENETTEEMKE